MYLIIKKMEFFIRLKFLKKYDLINIILETNFHVNRERV